MHLPEAGQVVGNDAHEQEVYEAWQEGMKTGWAGAMRHVLHMLEDLKMISLNEQGFVSAGGDMPMECAESGALACLKLVSCTMPLHHEGHYHQNFEKAYAWPVNPRTCTHKFRMPIGKDFKATVTCIWGGTA